MRKLLIILTALILGCSNPDIEIPAGQNVVVIEGWVTDEDKQHWVKLSRTVSFDSDQQEEPIEDAIVTVNDGSVDRAFVHTTDGVYVSDVFAGIETTSYSLSVMLSNGRTIVSDPENLNPVPVIENISISSFIRQNPDTGEDETVYYPVVQTQDPEDEENYYRYKGFKNGELLNDPEQLELLSDQFINGQLLPHNISRFEYDEGDVVTIELLSISKEAFDFLELLKLQTTSLGSSSGTAPAVLQGNLRYTDSDDLVLGFFGASAVESGSVTVQ